MEYIFSTRKKLSPIRKCWLILLPFLLNPALHSQGDNFPFHVSQLTLKNGLHVIISEDDSFPLVSVVIAYNVGSADEKMGKTGLAYLLENLMFQGSKHVARMQHVALINKIGGRLNALTSEEKTVYYQTVPSNQLPLVLWLESDRMNFLEITESKVERTKDSLLEEIKHRKEIEPYFESLSEFDRLARPGFSYSHPVIGTENDIRNLTLKDVKDFYSTYYAPNNAVLCIAGNVNRSKVEELVRRYFGTLAEGKSPPPRKNPEELKKVSTTQVFEEVLAPTPGFHLGYRLPSPLSNDFYPLQIIEYILLRGRSSRLHKRLMARERLAYSYSGGIEKWKHFSLLKVSVLANNEVMTEMCRKAVYSEVNRIRTTRIPDKELTKAKNMLKADYVSRYSTTLGRALFLVDSYLQKGSLSHLATELSMFLGVTPGDIIRVAHRYLSPDNRILLTVRIK
ncbi:MAG: M16 family metallopeptidase [Candidatus Aminicenantales bacterium]